MNFLSWLIVIIPLLCILGMAFYAKKYVRDIADYLAAGRVAGRYVISVGDLTSGLSVITLVALCEQNYQCGMAINFWNAINTPIAILISLSGYCIYRFRQTKCLSAGQFLELRYSRSFRIVAALIRTLAEALTNAIGPAVAVRFFIYFLGIPHKIVVMGYSIPTYGILVVILLIMALAIIWPGGRISLLITDCLQGIISYPIFVIFTVFILTQLAWFQDIAPVMSDRIAGESFLNPMDIKDLRDFNVFALVVVILGNVLNRAAWIGNDTTTAGKNPHEQKMAGILGSWRNGFAFTMMTLIGLFVITFMLHGRFAEPAHQVRLDLSNRVAEEVFEDKELRARVIANLQSLPVANHQIGIDIPYSRENNPDTSFLNSTLSTINKTTDNNGKGEFQEFRSLYYQMMMPVMLKKLFPPILMGFFTLLMIMLLLSTDDSRIFNASSTIIQDIILPLRTTPLSMEKHLIYLKRCSLGVTLFFFVVSIFFAQLDFINMFVIIMCSVWLGAAGPIMVGGLYTKFGTTFGAWCALFVGSGISVLGLVFQRNWADYIYPFLTKNNYAEEVGSVLEIISKPFNPFIVWKMDAIKFPINSMEIYFFAMVLGVVAYVVGSLATYKEPFNLDRLLHRGKYGDSDELNQKLNLKTVLSWGNFYEKFIGITSEYTLGDKIISWSVFVWSIVYSFGFMFCGVLVWNMISPWSNSDWARYFFITTVVAALIVGVISTIWFLIGGIIDTKALFRDLEKRVINPLDDGRVTGHVSLSDKANFDKIENNKL